MTAAGVAVASMLVLLPSGPSGGLKHSAGFFLHSYCLILRLFCACTKVQ
jgi:hypothetical protein